MANTKNTTINSASLTTLPARKQPYRDQLVTGLCLHVGAKRRRWLIQYRQAGALKEMTLGFVPKMGLADARAEAKAIKERVEVGAPVTVAPAVHPKAEKVMTVEALLDEFETVKGRAGKRVKSLDLRMKALRRELKPYFAVPARDITKRDFRDIRDKMAKRDALQMSDRFLNYANTVWLWASKEDYVESNVVPSVQRIGPGTVQRKRTLTDDELRAIWQATFTLPTEGGASYARMIRFLMIVPARITEARLAIHGEFLGGRWRLEEDRNKSAREFRLMLPDMALTELGQGTANERCFPKNASVGRYKEWLDEACGVSDWVHHDLRRTIASRLQELDTQPHVIGALLNHAAAKGADAHYMHGDLASQKAEALALWEGELKKILSAKSAAKTDS
ncbi:DUF4102 domain-containing protein [Sinorhizobium medicae]|nr:DUF4102 domain-containing protein [Sinorhizobium medicae]